MKKILILIITTSLFTSSCKNVEKEKEKQSLIIADTTRGSKSVKVEISICKDNDTLEYQDDKISVYNEFKTRGSGVLSITIIDKVTILNDDDTIFGEIISNDESGYEIKLPSKIVARSFVPLFDIFSFDAEQPDSNDEFLKIYINKELKKINKSQVEFDYKKWEDYVKGSFVKIRNCNKPKDYNVYRVLKIDNNLIKIKSISKKSCDMIENYTDVTKEIEWKNENGILLIHFFSCN